jgi:hypothetical protein
MHLDVFVGFYTTTKIYFKPRLARNPVQTLLVGAISLLSEGIECHSLQTL